MALACDYANDSLDFDSFPIYGILCDGHSFDFFSFDGSTKPPTFSRGIFKHDRHSFLGLSVGYLGRRPAIDFILSLRPICEAIFSCLLIGYRSGLQAYFQRSVQKGSEEEKGSRPSTSGWEKSLQLANEAFDLAVKATSQAAMGDMSSNTLAEDALRKLTERHRLHSLEAVLICITDLEPFVDEPVPKLCQNPFSVLNGISWLSGTPRRLIVTSYSNLCCMFIILFYQFQTQFDID